MADYIPNLDALIDFSFIGQKPTTSKPPEAPPQPLEPQPQPDPHYPPHPIHPDSTHTDWQLGYLHHNVPPFLGKPGLNQEVPDTEVGFYRLFITQFIVLYLVKELNHAAQLELTEAQFKKFPLITPEEVNDFICLILYMGICKLPTYRLYWQRHDNPYFQKLPSTLMTYKRFANMKRYFKVFDQQLPPSGDESNTKSKLSEIFEYFNNIFSNVYSPERELVLEENLCSLSDTGTNHLPFTVKPVKFDVELFALCEASSGYVCGFTMHKSNKAEKNIEMVSQLTKDFQHRNHHVYMDNFYTSIPLFKELKSVGIFCCGSQRDNGCGPKSFRAGPRKMNEGESILKHNMVVNCLELNDNIGSVLITNIHPEGGVLPNQSEMAMNPTQLNELKKSEIVQAYNQNMRGANMMYHVTSNYEIEKKAKKWSTKLCIHALNMAFYNGYCMYKRFSGHSPPRSYLDYLTAVIMALQAEGREPLRSDPAPVSTLINPVSATLLPPESSHPTSSDPRPASPDHPQRIDHFLVPLEKRKRCVYCVRHQKRREVLTRCQKCDTPLCHLNCFEKWHNE